MTPAPFITEPASTPEVDQEDFFRPWAIRQSEASKSDTSPPVSPLTVVTQRNRRKRDTGRSRDSLSGHSALAYEEVAKTLVAHSMPISAASAGNPTIPYAGPSSEAGRSPQALCTNGSFVGSYAEKSTGRPPLRRTRYTSREGSSSQPIRLSSSPNMKNAGYLPEERIEGSKPVGQHDTRLSARPASASDVLRSTRPANAFESSPGSDPPFLHACKDGNGGSDSHWRRHEKPKPRMPVTKVEKEGLYRRIKRYLGLRYEEFSSSDTDVSNLRQQGTETDDMLKGVSRTLRDHQEKVSRILDVRSGGRGLPITFERPRPPESLSSSYEVGVLSDSWFFRNDGTSKPPLNTPDPDAVYRGPDGREYLKVELSAPHAPTFLPSEAMKISTPPLSPLRNKAGKMRGFFFDLDAVKGGEGVPHRGAGGAPIKTAPVDAYRYGETDINWFRVSVGFETVVDEFQLDVPDHLPNSPLCPRHPKNKSGGTGICVYHGRRHSSL